MSKQISPRSSKKTSPQKTQRRIQHSRWGPPLHSRWGPPLPGLRSPELRKPSLRKARVASRKLIPSDDRPVHTLSRSDGCPEDNPAGSEAHPMEEDFVAIVTLPGEEETQRTEASRVRKDTQIVADIDDPKKLSAFLEDKPNKVRRSIRLYRKFCWVVTHPSFLQDLEQSYVVVVLFDKKKNKLHIKGEKENASACHFYVKTLMAAWRQREAQ